MLCPNCHKPMKNEKGSEKGLWRDNYYETREIKECSDCEIKVEEIYSAKIIKDPNHYILDYER